VKELTKSLEPSMANAATAILDAAHVGFLPAVRWHKMCATNLELVGRNIFNPTHDATTRLLRGDIKQGSQTVLEYGMRMRVAVHQAASMPGMAVCELFIRGLQPQLINVCARTEASLIWEDFNGCIAYANGKEHLIPKPVHSVNFAQPMRQGAGQATRHHPYARTNDRAASSRFGHKSRGSARGAFCGTQLQEARCHNCNELGHFKANCPALQGQGGRGGGHRGQRRNTRGQGQ
jgi:hypothetical protein